MLQTQPQGATTIGLTIRDNTPHSLQAQGQTLLNSLGSVHAIAAVAITHANPQRYAALPTHPETEEHLFEIVPPVFAVPVGRPGSPWCFRFVLIQNDQDHSFAPTPSREHMRRVGWDEVVNKRGDLQAS
jgi:hypothetical protein